MVIFGQKTPILGQNMAKNDPFSTKNRFLNPKNAHKWPKITPKNNPKPGLSSHIVDFNDNLANVLSCKFCLYNSHQNSLLTTLIYLDRLKTRRQQAKTNIKNILKICLFWSKLGQNSHFFRYQILSKSGVLSSNQRASDVSR